MNFIERRSADTKRYIFLLFVAIGAVTALITALIAQMSWRGWVKASKRSSGGSALRCRRRRARAS
jgi:trehalose 6-phosphate synthase